MKQNDIKKLPMAFLNAALVLQIIFFLCSFVIVVMPDVVLRIAYTDYSGGYSMPFDYIHFAAALITTILFGVMYTLLMLKIKKGEVLGLGFGIFLGILAYVSYFLATYVTTEFVIVWLNNISTDNSLVSTWSLGLEENINFYTLLVKCHLRVKYGLKTAIILVLLAYGVYALRNKQQNLPRKLY